jgi:hypothetical protein
MKILSHSLEFEDFYHRKPGILAIKKTMSRINSHLKGLKAKELVNYYIEKRRSI